MSHKVVYNACHGGFSLSREARDWLAERGCEQAQKERAQDPACSYGYRPEMDRHDPLLVDCVETLGDKANGMCASLAIAAVSGLYRIDEYDGNESVEEPADVAWINPENRASR